MTLYEVMSNYVKEKSDNQLKKFQMATLNQYLAEECKCNPGKKNMWAKKAILLKAGFLLEDKWQKIMQKIDFGEYQQYALNNTEKFGKQLGEIAKQTEIDLENPKNTKVDLPQFSKINLDQIKTK